MAKGKRVARQEQRAAKQETKRKNTMITAAVAVAFIALLAFVTWQSMGGGAGLDPATIADPALGPADAKVTITEYADFGCPACRTWHNTRIREQILAAFPDQVRFVWKDFPVVTPQSPLAAQAGQCAGAQGKFWEYHDQVFENFGGLERGTLSTYATAVGLDVAAFDKCLDDGDMQRKVQASDQEARRLGIRGTPGFAINGVALAAPPSLDQLTGFVQQALAKP